MTLRRGIGLVELLIAMVITLILGGAAVTLMQSGMDIEKRTVSGVLAQQSLQLPYIEILSQVERASKLVISDDVPAFTDLLPNRRAIYLSSEDAQMRRFLMIRTADGERRLPGFYNISDVLFERDEPDGKFIRLALTARHNGVKPFDYIADLFSLNSDADLSGMASGRVLLLETDSQGSGPAATTALRWAGIKERKPDGHYGFIVRGEPGLPLSGTGPRTTIAVDTRVVGDYLLLHTAEGEVSGDVEYQWRLYDDVVDTTANTLSSDTIMTPPTVPLDITNAMRDRFLAFAAKYNNEWVESDKYLVEGVTIPSSSFFSDLLLDTESGFTVTEGFGNNYIRLRYIGDEQYIQIGPSNPQTVVTRAFLTKSVDDKYFPRVGEKRVRNYCIENFSIWLDFVIDHGHTHGWGVLINGTVGTRNTGDSLIVDKTYGYTFDFDYNNKRNLMRKLEGASLVESEAWGIEKEGRFPNYYHWDELLVQSVLQNLKGKSSRIRARLTVLTKTGKDVDGTAIGEHIICRVQFFDVGPVFSEEEGCLVPTEGAKVSKTMWFGTENPAYWNLIKSYGPENNGGGSFEEPGSISGEKETFELKKMLDETLNGNQLIGRIFGIRIWSDKSNPGALDVYSVELSRGFEDDEVLPWGVTAGNYMEGWWESENTF